MTNRELITAKLERMYNRDFNNHLFGGFDLKLNIFRGFCPYALGHGEDFDCSDCPCTEGDCQESAETFWSEPLTAESKKQISAWLKDSNYI